MNVGLQSQLLAVCPNSTSRLERRRELQRTTATHFAERQVSGAADIGSVDLTDSNQSEADLAQKAWQSVQCSLTLSDYPNRPRLLAVLSVPPRRLLAQRDGRSCSHRPDPKLGPDQQRSEIAIELADVDAWLFGTLDVAKPLVRVPPVEVFEAQPA